MIIRPFGTLFEKKLGLNYGKPFIKYYSRP